MLAWAIGSDMRLGYSSDSLHIEERLNDRVGVRVHDMCFQPTVRCLVIEPELPLLGVRTL